MIVKQISVFIENKPGKLSEFIKILADNKIDLLALSVAEAQDYGLLRIIVDKTDETIDILRKTSWICKVTPVLAVVVPDEPGSLTKILATLADNGINLAYTYAFFSRTKGEACIILRVDDNEKAEKLLENM